MKKILTIFALTLILAIFITGCAKKGTVETVPTNTQNQATGSVIDNQAINEADATTKAVDTTQVDKDLSGAATSLNNW